jgi:unconventional prefoldin RPB5 interactor 1
VSTISKQVQKLEDQLSKVLEEMDKEDDDTPEPELPITEILEELDEDGNIISSKVTQPEQQTAKIVETLRKAGIKDIDPKSKDGVTNQDPISETIEKPKAASANKTQDTPKAVSDAPKATKKGVSFAEEVQKERFPPAPTTPVPANHLESTLLCSMAHSQTASVSSNWTTMTN